MPRRFARRFACSPKCNCAVSFQGPRRSVLSSGLWDLADGLVWGKTALGTFAGSTFYENAAESRFLRRWPSAKHAVADSVECTNRKEAQTWDDAMRRSEGWEPACDPDSELELDVASRRTRRQRPGDHRVEQAG